jgi:hypothetical protein
MSITSVVELGSSTWSVIQATITTTATLLAPANTARNGVAITNLGTTDIYLGGSGVTTANGALLVGTKGTSKFIPTKAAVYGIVGAGSQAVSVEDYF